MNLTEKQENFCIAYIETGNASEAYRRAYNVDKMKDASVNRKAKEVLDNGKITARLEQLRKPIIERHKITVDDLIRELDENRLAALSAETVQAAAATAATMAKAKLLGFDKQIVELTGSNGGPIQTATHNMTPEQYKATLNAALDKV